MNHYDKPLTLAMSLGELSQLVDAIEDAYVPEGEDSLSLEGHQIRPLYLRLREVWEQETTPNLPRSAWANSEDVRVSDAARHWRRLA